MSDADPRLGDDCRRRVPATPSASRVTLVGVVHDHPASAYRARAVVRSVEPAVLALELPPMALPLYDEYARDDRTPPAFGGEMSAAIQAAGTDRVVGIDGPSLGFARHLARRLVSGRHSAATVRDLGRSLASVTRHALTCRAAALLSRRTGVRVEVDDPSPHDCDTSTPPAEQARDERAQVRQARTVMQAFGTSGAGAVRKATREDYMVTRLVALRGEGETVAVVGAGHVAELADRLREG